METVTSVRNPALKQVRKALAKGSLTDHGFCVAEGFHLLEEALRSGCEIGPVFATEAAAARLRGVSFTIVAEALLRGISTTETPQGVVALVRPPLWTLERMLETPALLVVLDGVQDPGNAGAILRAAEAFGATGAAFLKGSVNPFNPKALRASAGSAYRVPLLTGLDPAPLLDRIQDRGLELFALMPGRARELAACRLDRACALVIGSEGRGVSPELSARAAGVRIPTTGVESLNAAMAATVVLYEAGRQRAARS